MPDQNQAMSYEQLLISSVIVNGDMNTALAAGVKSEMFNAFDREWNFLVRMYTRHKKSPSIITFRQRFKDFQVVKTADDTSFLAEEIKRIDTKNALVEAIRDSMEEIKNDDIDAAIGTITGVLSKARNRITVVQDNNIISDYEEVLADVREIRNRVDTQGSAGIAWGFDSFDARTGGAKPGELVTVAARLGHGKSQMLTKWAVEAIRKDFKVLFFSLEMGKSQVAMRVHSLLSPLIGGTVFDSAALMLGRSSVDLDEYEDFLRLTSKCIAGHLNVIDQKRGKIQMRDIRNAVERSQPDVVFVDYVQLLDRHADSSSASVGAISTEFKVLGEEYRVPFIIASQLNRAQGITRTMAGPEAIAQSDQIGQDSDQIIMIKQNSPSTVTMRSVKNRHGQSNFSWHVDYRPGDGVIEECSYERMQELQDKDKNEEEK